MIPRVREVRHVIFGVCVFSARVYGLGFRFGFRGLGYLVPGLGFRGLGFGFTSISWFKVSGFFRSGAGGTC